MTETAMTVIRQMADRARASAQTGLSETRHAEPGTGRPGRPPISRNIFVTAKRVERHHRVVLYVVMYLCAISAHAHYAEPVHE